MKKRVYVWIGQSIENFHFKPTSSKQKYMFYKPIYENNKHTILIPSPLSTFTPLIETKLNPAEQILKTKTLLNSVFSTYDYEIHLTTRSFQVINTIYQYINDNFISSEKVQIFHIDENNKVQNISIDNIDFIKSLLKFNS